MLTQYNLKMPHAVYGGENAMDNITAIIKARGAKKVAMFTDKGIEGAGLFALPEEAVKASGAEYYVLDELPPEPSYMAVQKLVDEFKVSGADLIVACGGGSVMDAAKLASVLVTDAYGVKELLDNPGMAQKCVPIVLIPTTAGTGSECTSFYIVTDPVRHSKMAMVDPNCMVSIAVNDTDFMSSMPPKLTAATGMDALTHAIEAALSRNANPLTDKDAYWAMQAIVQNLPRAVANGQDEAARTMMAYAENVAGMAFSNAGLGMVHAMAHALGGHYNLPHGVCNAVLLPYVLAFNSRSPVCRERFMTIAAAMGLQDTFTPDTAAPAVIQFVRQLSAGVGIPANLAQLNKVDPADFAALAELALHDTCMSTNQITPTRGEVVAVYTAAFRG